MAANSIIFYFIFCGLFFLGQLQRLELGNFSPFYLHDVLVILWLVYIIFSRREEIVKLFQKINYKKFRLELTLGVWIIFGWLIALLVGELSTKFILYGFRFISYSFLFFFIYKFKLIKDKYLKWGYFLTGFYLLLFGILQYVFVPDMRFLSILGWDDHYYRLIGSQFDPNFMGIIFVLLFFNFNQIKLKYRPDLKYLLLFLILIGITLTFSRASYLSFLIGMVLLSKFNFKKYFYVVLLFILIILAPKPGGEGVDLTRTASINARLESSQSSVSSLKPYQYLIGQGLFNKNKDSYTTQDYRRSDHALLEDNFILLIFNATGIVGLGLVIFILSKYLLSSYKKNQVKAISLIVVLVHAMFNNTVFQPFIFLYLVWGLISKVDR
jgi:hypothetical protein